MAKERYTDATFSDEESPSDGPISDLMRRAMALGLSGFFMTEEALRKALGDNLPKDWVDFASSQSERTRREFAQAVAAEIGKMLEGVDMNEMLAELLQKHPVEIRAKVRLLPEEDDPERRAERSSVEFEFDAGGENGDRRR